MPLVKEVQDRIGWSDERRAKMEARPKKAGYRKRSPEYLQKCREKKKITRRKERAILNLLGVENEPPPTVCLEGYKNVAESRKKSVRVAIKKSILKVVKAILPNTEAEEIIQLSQRALQDRRTAAAEPTVEPKEHFAGFIILLNTALKRGIEQGKYMTVEDKNLILQQGSLMLSMMGAVGAKPTKLGMEALLGGTVISDTLYAEIRDHGEIYGPGAYVTPPRKNPSDTGGKKSKKSSLLHDPFKRNHKESIEKMRRLVGNIISNTSMSASSRKFTYTNYSQVNAIKLLRNLPVQTILNQCFNKEVAYRKQQNGETSLQFKHKRTNHGQMRETIKRNVLFRDEVTTAVIKLLVPSGLKSLAALDIQTDLHIRLNMPNIKKLGDQIVELLPEYADLRAINEALHISCDKAEIHLKSRDTGLWSPKHFKGNPNPCTGPNSHCPHNIFNVKDPRPEANNPDTVCGHYHDGVCLPCEQLFDVPEQLQAMYDYVVTKLEALANGVEKQKKQADLLSLKENKDYYIRRYKHAMGHQYRLMNESEFEETALAHMKANPDTIYIDIDWAMKFLSLRYRESMADYFGKHGIAWLGARVCWWDSATQEFRYYFTHAVSQDDKEDGKLSARCLATILETHRKSYPENVHDSFILSTDGAGAFAGLDFSSRLAYFYEQIGWRCIMHATNESGGAKSEVDGSFGTGRVLIRTYVTSKRGSGDVGNANDLVSVLQKVQQSCTLAYRIDPTTTTTRCKLAVPDTKEARKAVSQIKMQSQSLRMFQYTGRAPSVIQFFPHSCLGNVAPSYTLPVDTLYAPGTDRSLIVPRGIQAGPDIPLPPTEHTDFTMSGRQNIGVKRLRSEKAQLRSEMAERAEVKRQKKEAEYILSHQEPDISAYRHKCTYINCDAAFRKKGNLENHVAKGDHQMRKNHFKKTSSKSAQVPIALAKMSKRDLAIKFFVELTQFNGERTAVVGPELEAGLIEYGRSSNKSTGVGIRISVKHPKIDPEILECIRFMWNHGEVKGNNKIQPADMRTYIVFAGLESFEGEFGTEDNIFVRFQAETRGMHAKFKNVPEEYNIKLAMASLSIEKKNVLRIAAVPKLPEQQLRELFLSNLQRHETLLQQPEIHEAVVNALIEIGVGSKSLIEDLKSIKLKPFPSQANPWPAVLRKKIVEAIQMKPVEHDNMVPADEMDIPANEVDEYEDEIEYAVLEEYANEMILANEEDMQEEDDLEDFNNIFDDFDNDDGDFNFDADQMDFNP